MTAPSASPTPPGGPETPLQAAEAQTKRFAEALDKIRGRADTSAKTFGALATTALGAIALTKVADLFPLEPARQPQLAWALLGAIAGFLAMAVAAAWFTGRLWSVNAPIYTVSSLDIMRTELPDNAEYELVERIYNETGALNGPSGSTLAGYEETGLDKQRRASAETRTLPNTAKQQLLAEAALIRAEVREAQARAGALVVRRRAAKAATGTTTWIIVGLFVAGLLAFGAGTDWLAAERSDAKIALAKSCGEAQRAIADAKITGVSALPSLCGTPITPGSGASGPTLIQERAATVASLGTQWKDCISRLKQPPDEAACSPTLHLLLQVASGR